MHTPITPRSGTEDVLAAIDAAERAVSVRLDRLLALEAARRTPEDRWSWVVVILAVAAAGVCAVTLI